MATPHISAEKDAFADTVLMPGDPLRARYIAEHFLQTRSKSPPCAICTAIPVFMKINGFR